MQVRRNISRFVMFAACIFASVFWLFLLHGVRAAEPGGSGLPISHLLFTTSNHCISCHSQVKAQDGEDISIGYLWRSSVMANSSRDPYWQASIRRETMDHPSATSAIEDKCSTCHMPMQRFQAHAEGLRGEVLKYLASISSGAAMSEPEGRLQDASDPKATLAADGVSCTLCHQIKPDNFGSEESLDGGFLIDVTRKPEERLMYGPFDDPDPGRRRLMNSTTSYVPVRGDHIRDSALCASCHTLLTNAMDDKGNAVGVLPEQVPYQEWQHSEYANGQSCQSCHMPEVKGQAPTTSIHAQMHDGVRRHVFVGGNAFLLRMLKDNHSELGVAATPDELEASAKRSEALLGEQTADVKVSAPRLESGRVRFAVQVTSRTGHKLPTGYPARRAWLHVTVRDGQGRTVFESGAVRPDGSIVGNDNDTDALKFEPHYTSITDPGQVQIYESVMGDWRGQPTTGLLYGARYLKDNRLLPRGFNKATADARIRVVGEAMQDGDFTGGGDSIAYDVAASGAGPYNVTAELLYESIGYRWATNLEKYDAHEPRRFVGYYRKQSADSAKRIARAESRGG